MKKQKLWYLVMGVHYTFKGTVSDVPCTIPVKWAKGQVGACPVFENERDAKLYAGDKFEVVPVSKPPEERLETTRCWASRKRS